MRRRGPGGRPRIGDIDRYRGIIPRFDRLLSVARRPEPTTIRIAGGAGGMSAVRERLEGQGFVVTPVSGVPGFVRVDGAPFPVSKTLEHWLGDFYIQQAVTGLAAPALAPQPGEAVLDLCAAPGGKTTHLAELMGHRGIVVGADVDEKRIRALHANVNRLGYRNVLVMEADGRSFPAGALFDRVLVDAPCSAEGNLRQKGGRLRRRDASFLRHVTRVQEDLLRRALHLVRPGGIVLYVTCTFAPEENEGVVARVLDDSDCVLEPLRPDVPHAPGLTRFEGATYGDRMEGAVRIYPHHLDSGGLFMARIRRPGSVGGAGGAGGADGWTAVPPVFPGEPEAAGDRGERARRLLREMFGAAWTGPEDRWLVRGGSVWSHTVDRWPVPAWNPEGDWRVSALGLRGTKKDPRTAYGERPTSDLLRHANPTERGRIVELDGQRLIELLERNPVPVEDVERGFVALEFRGRILGRGWVKDGVLRNEISKARSVRLASFFRSTGRLSGVDRPEIQQDANGKEESR